MPRLPRLTASEIIRVLEQLGFTMVRSSGSHFIFRNGHGKRVTVPAHGTDTLHPKTLTSIMREAGMTVEGLLKMLD